MNSRWVQLLAWATRSIYCVFLHLISRDCQSKLYSSAISPHQILMDLILLYFGFPCLKSNQDLQPMNSYEELFIFSFRELYPSKNYFIFLTLEICYFCFKIYVSVDFCRFEKLFYLYSKIGVGKYYSSWSCCLEK